MSATATVTKGSSDDDDVVTTTTTTTATNRDRLSSSRQQQDAIQSITKQFDKYLINSGCGGSSSSSTSSSSNNNNNTNHHSLGGGGGGGYGSNISKKSFLSGEDINDDDGPPTTQMNRRILRQRPQQHHQKQQLLPLRRTQRKHHRHYEVHSSNSSGTTTTTDVTPISKKAKIDMPLSNGNAKNGNDDDDDNDDDDKNESVTTTVTKKYNKKKTKIDGPVNNNNNDDDEAKVFYGEYWEIEKVLDVRERVIGRGGGDGTSKKNKNKKLIKGKKVLEFLIQWKGSEPCTNTWEPEENLCDTAYVEAQRLIELQQQTKRRAKLGLRQLVVDAATVAADTAAKGTAGTTKSMKTTKKFDLNDDNISMGGISILTGVGSQEGEEEVTESEVEQFESKSHGTTDVVDDDDNNDITNSVIEDTNFDWSPNHMMTPMMDIERIAITDPKCSEKLLVSRSMGIPIVITHHTGFPQFASRWLSLVVPEPQLPPQEQQQQQRPEEDTALAQEDDDDDNNNNNNPMNKPRQQQHPQKQQDAPMSMDDSMEALTATTAETTVNTAKLKLDDTSPSVTSSSVDCELFDSTDDITTNSTTKTNVRHKDANVNTATTTTSTVNLNDVIDCSMSDDGTAGIATMANNDNEVISIASSISYLNGHHQVTVTDVRSCDDCKIVNTNPMLSTTTVANSLEKAQIVFEQSNRNDSVRLTTHTTSPSTKAKKNESSDDSDGEWCKNLLTKPFKHGTEMNCGNESAPVTTKKKNREHLLDDDDDDTVTNEDDGSGLITQIDTKTKEGYIDPMMPDDTTTATDDLLNPMMSDTAIVTIDSNDPKTQEDTMMAANDFNDPMMPIDTNRFADADVDPTYSLENEVFLNNNNDSRWLDLSLPYTVDVEKMMQDIGNEIIPILRKKYDDENPIKGHMSVRRFLRNCWPNGDNATASNDCIETTTGSARKSPTLYLHQWLFTASRTAVPKLCNQVNMFPHDILGDDLLQYWYNKERCAGDSPYQYIFMGDADTLSRLHRDNGGLEIFIAPIVGLKEVKLVHRSDGVTSLYNLDANIDQPNLNQFPMLYSARVWQSVIRPGEILVMPQGTYHQCRNITPCLSYHRFHLDTLNLKAFYESWKDQDAPDIDHEDVIWNAATELCMKVDTFVESIRRSLDDRHLQPDHFVPIDILKAVTALRVLRNVCMEMSVRLDEQEKIKDWKLLVHDVGETLHEFRYRLCEVIPAMKKT